MKKEFTKDFDLDYAKASGTYFISVMDKNYETEDVVLTPANPTGDTYSMAKLFTETAVGICWDQGLLKLDDKLTEILRDDLPESYDKRWDNVTVEMLMRHRAGLRGGFLDIDCTNVQDYKTLNYLEYTLTNGMEFDPDTIYRYSDGAHYLLSLMIEKVTGKSLQAFLTPTLMDVLGFREYAWSSCPLGHTIGATGLYARCYDVVKLGALYLNDGVYKGKRVLSEEWCKLASTNGYSLGNCGGGWIGKGGMCGQLVAYNKEKGIAVAIMGYSDDIDMQRILNVEEM